MLFLMMANDETVRLTYSLTKPDKLIVVKKKHGSNAENISHAVLRLGTKLWWLRAPLTFLHVTSGFEPPTL